MGRPDGRVPVAAPEELPATSADAVRGLASSRPFRRMAMASGFASLGDWMGFLAIIALTADIMGPTRAAAFAVSGVMAARVIPSLLLAPVAGVFVDRWDRKRVLVLTHVGRGLIMALIPFTQELLALILATLFLEVLSALFAPAKDAVFPTLVRREQLMSANQVNLVLTYGMLPLAGVLYAVVVEFTGRWATPGSFLADRPIAVPIWMNAATFFLAAALMRSITIRRVPVTTMRAQERVTAQFSEGLRFVAGHPIIRIFILGVMLVAAAAGVVITTGEFFANLLNAGPSGFGVLVAAVGLGMVGGLLLAPVLTRRLRPDWLFAPGLVVAGIGLILTPLAADLPAALAPAAVMGAGAGLVFIVSYTVLQQRADDRIRGRTFGAFNAGIRVAIFLATIAVPFAIGVIGRERPVLSVVEGISTLAYPYVFGGIRLSLITAGAVTVLGGLVLQVLLRRALLAEARHGGDLATGMVATGVGPEGVARRGIFVVFEGGDGSGKSTQLTLLREHLERLGLSVVVTREPGGTATGERIREILLDPDNVGLSDRAEALLYAAARAQHVAEVIEPALAAGSIVLCDRFIDSSIVYQGAGRGLGEYRIEELNLWATGDIVADVIILLDVSAEEGLRRAGTVGEPDRIEAAGETFHSVVREAYRRRADAEPHRWLLLDGRRSMDELQAQIRADVLRALAPYRTGA